MEPKSLLTSSNSCETVDQRPAGKPPSSNGPQPENKKPASLAAAGSAGVAFSLLRAGYEPPPAPCRGQHRLIATVVIRMRESIPRV